MDSEIYSQALSGLFSVTKYSYTPFNHYDKVMRFANGDTTDVYQFYYETFDPQAVSKVQRSSLGAVLYPNPAYNSIFVHFNKLPASPVNARIYNATGQMVISTVVHGIEQQLPIGRLAAGNYFVALESSGGTQQLKFVKD